MFEPLTMLFLAGLGLFAGVLGGMLGVGGSVIMIPGLVFLFGQNRHEGFNQHLYQAGAMIVNVAVLAPAMFRHYRAGALMPRVLLRILPVALIFIFVGVAASNLEVFSPERKYLGATGPVWLGRLLALFLVYVIYVNVQRLRRPRKVEAGPTGDVAESLPASATSPVRTSFIGIAMGFVAGLMGIGGGAVAVPLQQTLLHLPLRNCIANSSAIICVTAGFGAIAKNATLSQHGLDWRNGLLIAAMLAPTAIIGGLIGGKLTHVLPVRVVRVAFILLMAIAAWKMASL